MDLIENNSINLKIKDLEEVMPTSIESSFKFEELFFSVTDLKSVITFSNDTFIRISKYTEIELLGQLHKIVRHPDMPRCIFNIFWDFLKEKKPIAAYVKNLSKDGSYYWVLALAFPSDEGYISIRIKPGSELFDQVKKLYKSTLAYEKDLEKKVDKKSAMKGAEVYLIQQLNELGFSEYSQFMWIALQKEMKHRESVLKQTVHKKKNGASVPTHLLELDNILSKLVVTTDTLIDIHSKLATQSEYILNLARSIILLSINAQVGSAKLDQKDQSLSVVAEKMSEQSTTGESHISALEKNIINLNELIGEVSFNIISAKLQVEMNIYFKNEIDHINCNNMEAKDNTERASQLLQEAFMPRIGVICEGIEQINAYLKYISNDVLQIERFLMYLRFIHITGKVEVARMNEKSASFATTFQELNAEINNAEVRLKQLTKVVESNQVTLKMNQTLTSRLTRLKQFF